MTAGDGILLAVRLVLAAAFGFAGIAKLADRDGSRRALVGFGVPEGLAGPGAVLLPVLELAVAATLVPSSLAGWGGAGALLLLAGFTVGIAVNLALGRTPDCHCFGQVHAKPIGVASLARNGALGGMALVVLLSGAPPIGTATQGRSAAQLGGIAVLAALGAVCSVQTWLLLSLIRQNGRLLLRVDGIEGALQAHGILALDGAGLPLGADAPHFALPELSGETLTLTDLMGRGQPVVLVFTDPQCDSCGALLPDIARWQQAGGLTIAVISRGGREANRVETARHGLSRVLLQRDWEVSGSYRSLATPSAVLIDRDGRIASGAAAGAEAIRQLVSESRHDIPARTGRERPDNIPVRQVRSGRSAG